MDKENRVSESCQVETTSLKRTTTKSIESLTKETTTRLHQPKLQAEKMDSLVTIRPPRDPKHVHSVTVSANSTTFGNNHKQPLNPSVHCNRSSSQPRSSQKVELPSSKLMRGMSRSVSEQRISQNAHFLDGFNMADCFDVRTIPDPPPLSPSGSRRRQRRRSSSSVLRPMSSTDVTNRQNHQMTTSNTSDCIGKSDMRNQRKRKTLLHVPSPHFIASDDDGTRPNDEKCDREVRQEGMQIDLYEDDCGDETNIDTKRRKKRQSMVIPNHFSFNADAYSSGTTKLDIKNEYSLSSREKKFVPMDLKSMQKLRTLVRGYCALSELERGSCNEKNEILSMTGYALPKKVVYTNSGDKSEMVLSNRRLVIQKLAPVLAQMETRKKEDVRCWEEKTKCRVTKSNKSGRYKYHDVDSGMKVSSQEYKRRYISILDDERPNRASNAHLWMDALNLNSENSNTIEDKESICDLMKDHNDVEMEDSGDGTNECLDVCDPTICVDLNHEVNTSTRDEIAEITEASSEDTEDSLQESRLPPPTNSNPSENLTKITDGSPRERNGGLQINDVEKNDEIELLPLPSKDVESMDPDIAAAEKRLWGKIDLALQEYSKEVMTIRKRKGEKRRRAL